MGAVSSASGIDDAFDADIEDLWALMAPMATDRVHLVRIALTAAQAGVLDDAVRLAGQQSAHKLAGALGSYFRPTGSQAAAAAEQILMGAIGDVDIEALAAAVATLDCVLAGDLR